MMSGPRVAGERFAYPAAGDPSPPFRTIPAIPAKQTPRQSRLLAVLPTAECERLFPHLELVQLTAGQVLYESRMRFQHVYFPTDSVVSLLYLMEDGASAEIAVVGNEGLVGIALFMGGDTTPSRAVVRSAGYAYRLSGSLLRKEFSLSGALQHLLLRYTQALLTQMAQTQACSRASFDRSAGLPLAAAQSGPPAFQQDEDDPG